MSDTTGQVSDETLAELRLRRLRGRAHRGQAMRKVIIVSVSPDGEEARKVISPTKGDTA